MVTSGMREALIELEGSGAENMDVSGSLLAISLDKKFRDWFMGSQKPRRGIHGSAMISDEKDFCYREHVLATFFDPKSQESFISNRLARIFYHGHAVHRKWQEMFIGAGIAVQIEQGHRVPELDLTFTPDAVIDIMGKRRVVEIKSANTVGYKKTFEVPKMALRQCMFYMWWLSIKDGVVLMEDKNNQEFKIWPVVLDEQFIAPYINRVPRIVKLREVYQTRGVLPAKNAQCVSPNSRRAKGCAMVEQCFSKRLRQSAGLS